MATRGQERKRRVIASAGRQGATVSIVPRDGYPTQAQAQWRHPTAKKRERRTIAGVELGPGGEAQSKAQRTHLQQLAGLLHEPLVNAQPMPGEPNCPGWARLLEQAAPGRAHQRGRDAAALTVREALAAAYGASYADRVTARGRISGAYVRTLKGEATRAQAVSTWTDHARDLRRLADVVERELGPDEPWDSSEATYRRLRDAQIARVLGGAQTTAAPQKLRRVHKVLQTYIRATRLVQRAYQDKAGHEGKHKALVLNRWLTDLKTAWTARGLLLPNEEQPRYKLHEAGRIYAAGTRAGPDPRYGLWLELGMEGRPVQILRARRSHLADRTTEMPGGVFRGPGTQLKHGLVYVLTPAHRNKIDAYLRGFLREYEERYLAKAITDYPLFPAGNVVDGVIAFRANARPWGYRQFLGDAVTGTGFFAIEAAAGVPKLRDRGPYALKYTIADVVPVIAAASGVVDNVALHLATAHDTPGTTAQYRAKGRSEPTILRAVGKHIRGGVRKRLRRAATVGDVLSLLGDDSALDAERVHEFNVSAAGLTVRMLSGPTLWVPWEALAEAGERGVHVLKMSEEARASHELDDEAREITFSAGPERVVMRLKTMYERALNNDARHPGDAVLLAER